MTRDQAFRIMHAAVGDVGPNGHATLSHLATALDALGLLNYAAGAEPTPAPPTQDQPTEPDGSPDEPPWATKRHRA